MSALGPFGLEPLEMLQDPGDPVPLALRCLRGVAVFSSGRDGVPGRLRRGATECNRAASIPFSRSRPSDPRGTEPTQP
jgi:hypothetical protein